MHKRYHPTIIQWIAEIDRLYKVTVLLKNYNKVIYTDVTFDELKSLIGNIYSEFLYVKRVTIHQPTKRVSYNGKGRSSRRGSNY